MAVDDAFFFQGLPQSAIPQTLHGENSADHQDNLASEAALRAKDEARSAKLLGSQNAARQAAWAGRMALLDE